MKLSYTDMRHFDDKLDRIEAAVTTKLNELREENIRLLVENEKLKADIAAAVDTSEVVEQGAREGLPT